MVQNNFMQKDLSPIVKQLAAVPVLGYTIENDTKTVPRCENIVDLQDLRSILFQAISSHLGMAMT